MRVLVACEFSGIVRDAFIQAGHEALSCDLLPTESPGPHHQGDVREFLDGGWDLMIAHPPCTYLSKAGARWMYPTAGELNQERYEKALEAKKFFLTLLKAPIPKVAVENPTPLKVVGLPKEDQVIQPHQFGHPYSKRTLLWLKNLPKLEATELVEEYEPYLPSNTGGVSRGESYHPGTAKTSHEASRFWTGIAEAMASQWGEL